MSSLTESILDRLRHEATNYKRPQQRLATLSRLVEACDAICDGSAREVVKKGFPSAELNFLGRRVAISPPRIEEYVTARRMVDQKKGAKSVWTGPKASTLRKEGDGMLAYVRAREHERGDKQGRHNIAKTQHKWWNLIDQVGDEEIRGRLMRELAEGSEAKRVNAALKRAVYLCSPSFDIDSYLKSNDQAPGIEDSLENRSASNKLLNDALTEMLRTLLKRFQDNDSLAAFDLEFDGKRVRQRTTKQTLISAVELKVL